MTTSRRLRPGQLVAVIVSVLLAVAAAVSLTLTVPPVLRAAAPELPVRQYLQAIVDGHVERALELGHITPGTDDKLLTDAAYAQAANRLGSFTVLTTQQQGAQASVRVRLTQGSARYEADFAVERETGIPGISPWRLAAQKLPTVTVRTSGLAGAKVTIAGIELTPSNDAVVQHVLPGSYPIDPWGTDYYETAAATASATFTDSQPAVTLTPRLAAAGSTKIASDIAAWIAQCTASGELHPAGCPFQALPEDGVTYSAGRWALDLAPTVAESDWNGSAWPVYTVRQGMVTFTARAAQGDLEGTATTGSEPFAVTGTAVVDGDSVRFVPSSAYASDSVPGASA